MKTILRAAMAVFAMLLLSAFSAMPASAGCTPYTVPNSGARMHQQSWDVNDAFQSGLFTLISTRDVDPIVGFWNATFTSDGQVIDSPYVQWHSDGTEIMNSSRDPRTGSFCMGVWKKIGNNYMLNHFAKSWDADGNFIGPAQIREHIHLLNGDQSYSGDFILDQYDTAGNVLVHLTGEVAATRITVNTAPF